MANFKFSPSPIPGIIIIEPRAFEDNRGFFMELYRKESFARLGFTEDFVQDNHSFSKKGVVRGLHYQINPSPMGKLVTAIKGMIFDVGVDLRQGSPSFGKWYGELLTGESHKMLYFPPGFAHGFLCLEDDTHVLYKCTGMFRPTDERSLFWNDPAVGIKWPLDQANEIIVSDKDKANPLLKDIECNIIFNG